MALVGVISDTHGLLRDEAVEALRGVDAIVIAGDVGKPEVLERLAELAPVHAIRGNVDIGGWARTLPAALTVTLGGHRVHVVHNIADLDRAEPDADVVVFGHSHQPLIEQRDGVLFLNPGSAGPRRFKLPITLAHLRLLPGRPPGAELIELVPR